MRKKQSKAQMSFEEQQREARVRADAHKQRLRRQVRRDLAGGLAQALPVVAALGELLVEVATAHVGREATLQLFKHMIHEVERNAAPPRLV
jgi:hypothetical protein